LSKLQLRWSKLSQGRGTDGRVAAQNISRATFDKRGDWLISHHHHRTIEVGRDVAEENQLLI